MLPLQTSYIKSNPGHRHRAARQLPLSNHVERARLRRSPNIDKSAVKSTRKTGIKP